MLEEIRDGGIELSVVVPAFNEEKNIGQTVRTLGAWLSRGAGGYEIIVVDDGSQDRTAEIVCGLADDYPVRLIRETSNHGKGYAVRKGMLAAKGQYRIFMDADLSYPVDTIDPMMAALRGGADLAIGSRALPGSDMVVRPPLSRYVAGRIYSLIIQALLLPGLADTQCGFKGFTRRAACDLFPRLTLRGFAFDVELLYLARRLDYRITMIPVRLTFVNSTSKVRLVSDSLRMLRDLLRIRLNDRRGVYGGKQQPDPC